MGITRLHLLPIAIFILIPTTFIITYAIAVCLNHVAIEFPYISDTGTQAPESCIFSQLVNLIAVFLAVLMYVRYKQIEQHYRDHLSSESTVVLRLNRSALIIGWMGCIGVSVLANFQETSMIIVHMCGACTAFGSAATYSWLQTVMSHYVCPLLNSKHIARIRVLLSLILTAAFIITVVAGIIAHYNFHGKDFTHWHPSDGGFTAHVISTGAEWILVITFDVFILTFAKEMQTISISSPQIHFIIEDISLRSTEFFNSEDRVHIVSSHGSVRIGSLPNSPCAEENRLTTQAIVH